MEYIHKSVLLNEVLYWLDVKPFGTYIDATLGGGGHAAEIAKRLAGGGKLIGIDQDEFAINMAREVLAPYAEKSQILFEKANFGQIAQKMSDEQSFHVDGILMDLGVSSFQLDEVARGFSYNHDARLDMRMNRDSKLSAHDVVNKYDEGRLAQIFRRYGEERWAARIAQFIARERAKAPIDTTAQLVDIIKAAIPIAARRDGPHPAKRVFQAIRIEVNDELVNLQMSIENFVDILKPGGVICIITFHSLEDRIVKDTFRILAADCLCPREFPVCICNKRPDVEILTKRPITPSKDEIANNPRARSAKLRVARKLRRTAMDKLGIFLAFNGNCNEALEFYAKVFDTKPGQVMKYGDGPSDRQIPGFEDKVMYSDMVIGGENVMLSDAPPHGAPYVAGNNFCMSYSGKDFDRLHRVFDALSDGGTVMMPMQKTFFSELYGMVTDKFGIAWNVMA
jgi:16S rRNA (cytosine1402-N4)-methyltransferase